ncbi:MAG: macro domain-containing protein [Clostridiales bacterium]|jgi:O-acetyl-ADP-ribose deacetylase (regulator of RNase III)|nr:macro domain-containing protein [Clostridiales bacterium]
MALSIVSQDLTKSFADAIVSEKPGAGNIGVAEHVIDVVSPAFDEQDPTRSKALLKEAYATALGQALSLQCESVLFPLLAIENGYPKVEALKASMSAISEFLADNEMEVKLAVEGMKFPTQDLDMRFELDKEGPFPPKPPGAAFGPSKVVEYSSVAVSAPYPNFHRKPHIEPVRLDASFSEKLFEIIDEKGKTDPEIYKKANIDRKHFSKIKNKHYKVGVKTALALAIALELNFERTQDLLGRAGYTLSPSILFDVVIKRFIEKGIFDIGVINEDLVLRQLPILGGAE